MVDELFKNKFLYSKIPGDTAPSASLQLPKIYGIYFSKHNCPPGSLFTPVLKQIYAAVNSQAKIFEVIFVSGDNT